MEITIGRDSKTRQLSVIKDGKAALAGQAGSVPQDVSRQHVQLRQQPDGKWQLKNLNEQNVTFVNGLAVESKVVTEKDKIELGQSHYLLSWEAIKGPKVVTIDLKPLRQAWERYTQTNINIRKRQQRMNLLARVTPAFSMVSGLVAGIVPEVRAMALVLTGAGVLVFLYSLYRSATDHSIEETEDAKKRFQREYVCPKCGRFLGFQDIDILTQQKGCPYCKTPFENTKK